MTSLAFACCGSFCTLRESIDALRRFGAETGAELTPIMSPITRSLSTRFGGAEAFAAEVEDICGRPVLSTVAEAEPIGPKALLDLLIIAPCTGNTLAKLAAGITDTAPTMAAKAHLRGGRPVLLAVSTNDALGGAAKNIGALLDRKHIYFVPFRQDAPKTKPRSCVADFSLVGPAAEAALAGEQLMPLLLGPAGGAV